MNYQTQFEITEEIQLASLRSYFYSILIGKRIWAMAALLAGTLVLFLMDTDFGIAVPIVLACGAALILAIWLRVYLVLMRQGRDLVSMLDSPVITITVTDEELRYESSNATRVAKWRDVDKHGDTGDYLILMKGRFPLANLPKRFLADEAIAFIKSKSGKRIA